MTCWRSLQYGIGSGLGGTTPLRLDGCEFESSIGYIGLDHLLEINIEFFKIMLWVKIGPWLTKNEQNGRQDTVNLPGFGCSRF